MSNSIIIADTHFDNNVADFQHKLNFFEKYVINNKQYKNIFFEGDIFDNKKSLDTNMLISVINKIFDNLLDRNIYIVTGNHDLYYKNEKTVNSLELLERMYSNIKVIKQDEVIQFTMDNGKVKKVYAIPYGFAPDKNKLNESDFVIGHVEVYPLFPRCKDFITVNDFEDKNVYLGHYHKKVSHNNIHYIGVPYGLDFNDIDDIKGIYEIKDDNSLKFIENTISPMYRSIYFDPDYLLISSDQYSHEHFKENIETYKKDHFYVYIENEKTAADFLTYLDANGVDYVTKFIAEPTDEDEIELISEDIFETIEYFLEEKDKLTFKEIIEDIKGNEKV